MGIGYAATGVPKHARLRRAIRRPQKLTNLVDQVVSSGSNFVVIAFIARAAGPVGYASFTLASVVWFLALGTLRSIVVDPMTLTVSKFEGSAADRHMRQAYWRAVWAAIAAGVVVAVASLISAPFAPHYVLPTGLALAVALPFMLMQDACRWQGLSVNRAGLALRNDIVFAVIETTLIVVLWVAGDLTAVTGLLAIGAGAFVAVAYSLRQYAVGRMLAPWELGVFIDHSAQPGWLLVDFFFGWTTSRATLFVLVGALGRSDLGLYRAATDLFGPLRLLQLSLVTVLMPASAAAFNQRGTAELRRTYHKSLAWATGLTLVYSAAATFAGAWILRVAYGPDYRLSTTLIGLVGLSSVMMSVQIPALVAMKAALRMRTMMMLRIVTAPAVFALYYFWAKSDGLRGAALATAVSVAAVTAMIVWATQHGLRRAEQDSSGTAPTGAVTARVPAVSVGGPSS